MRVLGIETSCDETGVAIYDASGLLVHALYSQTAIHAEYGGVVPELASRDHVRKILPLIESVLQKSKTKPSDLACIAYTNGPGLVGALLVGATIARSLGFSWNIPTVAVNHMEAHLLASMLENPDIEFPFLALLVSGGHTQLVEVKAIGNYVILGDSIDDAAGEAFDKVAKILGLPYPGGPALSILAQKGDPKRLHFPRPMVNRKGLDFSFSGLKTFAKNSFNENINSPTIKEDVARAFQDAIVDTLVIKCRRALKQTNLTRLVVAGGVSANQELRNKLHSMVVAQDATVYFPRLEFCTDNGAMIAYCGYRRFLLGERDQNLEIVVEPRKKLGGF